MYQIRIANRGYYQPITRKFSTEKEATEYLNNYCDNFWGAYVDNCEHSKYPQLKPLYEEDF